MNRFIMLWRILSRFDLSEWSRPSSGQVVSLNRVWTEVRGNGEVKFMRWIYLRNIFTDKINSSSILWPSSDIQTDGPWSVQGWNGKSEISSRHIFLPDIAGLYLSQHSALLSVDRPVCWHFKPVFLLFLSKQS